jgi:uncharacterized protein YihD (DUF1040 family)
MSSDALAISYKNNNDKAQIPIPIEADEEEDDKLDLNRASSNVEFTAEIREWQKSNEGNYIEYVIQFAYVGGKSWTLNKRYSDFVYVHNKIQDSTEEDIPKLPPKIENRSPEQLEIRMKQLQEYLNQHLFRYPISQHILEFCEFEGQGSLWFKEISRKHIKYIELVAEDKFYKLTNNGNVDTFFGITI